MPDKRNPVPKKNILQDNTASPTPTNLTDLFKELDLKKAEFKLKNELLQAQIELERSRAKYAELYELAPVGYFTLDENGSIQNVNQAGANLLGLKKEALLNHAFSRYVIPEFQNHYIHHFKDAMAENELKICEVKLSRKNGPIFYAKLNSKTIFCSHNGEKRLFTIVLDITQRKLDEQSLHFNRQQIADINRASTLEELAASISYEINQPLGNINNFLHGSIRRLANDEFNKEEVMAALTKAADQSHRIAELVLRMKNFVCKGVLQKEFTCLNNLIEESVALLEYEIAQLPMKIHHRPAKNLPLLFLDKIHIQQVILNLARNAIDAMRDAKTVEPQLTIEVNQVDLVNVEVSICDNGPGIDTEMAHQLFSPYFTTKAYGTGLGLAVSRNIVEAHGGHLSVLAAESGGSCFKFSLLIQPT